MSYEIVFEENPKYSDLQALGNGIMEDARKQKGFKPWEFFAFFIRDDKNKILGGCNGNIFYGCLYIDQLWVIESLRGQHYGTKLIRAAERLGREKKCTFAVVNTMDWEALDFYKKQGFTVEFERHGFDKGSVCYSLAKELKKDLASKQVTESVDDGIDEDSIQSGELIPNTHYKLYKNIKNTFEIIDAQLYAFNKKCVPATQVPESIDIRYVIKENDDIIAGICGNVYTWKILYLELLFVNEAHRNKRLATFLLKKVEEQAKAMDVSLIHTDTYDFQAKDFYLKHGYEIFGVLDDCPQGHKRYYLKKEL